MKKISILLLISFFVIACSKTETTKNRLLKVSENGRFLEFTNGEPFLYLGCTAWELFHKLNREEAAEYLTNRSEKGFTVIQAVILAEMGGLKVPNAYGEIPLIDQDPTKPNEKYFEHVDFIVAKAEELGLFIGMLPTWGDKVTAEHGGEGVIFNSDNARFYGEFLGKRYKDKPVIWILGGDRNVSNDTVFQIWKAMAEGLRAGDSGEHLITMHPRGNKSSSEWFHKEDWLDFNLYQSGHGARFNNVYEYAQHDYLLQPAKPCVDGEPAYENIPVKFWEYCDWSDSLRVPREVLDSNLLISDKSYFDKGFFTDYDIRIHAYWNLLSGACGYTYGNNAIWQMFRKGGSIAIPCLYDWRESMDQPGAKNIRYLRSLFESRSFTKIIPDQTLIQGDNPKDSSHIVSAIASDRSFLLVYLAIGQTVSIDMSNIIASEVQAWWFNPRDGNATLIGSFDNKEIKDFVPPSGGLNNDWVLVLEDADSFRDAPGLSVL